MRRILPALVPPFSAPPAVDPPRRGNRPSRRQKHAVGFETGKLGLGGGALEARDIVSGESLGRLEAAGAAAAGGAAGPATVARLRLVLGAEECRAVEIGEARR